MEWTINGVSFVAERGDITKQDTEAVVNAANKELAPGGGVAGAIHRAAGQELTDHCRDLGRCETGEAMLTPGFELEADYIIHTVGPVYDSDPNPEQSLRDSYRNSLELALDEDIRSVSFPLLSTGAFGYPVDDASRVAVETVSELLQENNQFDEIRFILWGESDFETFKKEADNLLK